MNCKKTFSVLLSIVIIFSFFANGSRQVSAATERTVYVSALTGNDSNSGTESAPYKTFAKAYSRGSVTTLTVILLDNAAIESSFVFDNNGTTRTIVTAAAKDITLDLSAKDVMGFYTQVTFKNITLGFKDSTIFCANGKNIVIEDTVTFTNRIKAFGGGNSTTVASTNMELYGGSYYAIYSGGHSGSVTGNARLTLGGKINPNDSIDDSSNNISKSYVYGGCYNGTVGGSTEINFGGNAITKYIVGTGYNANDTIGGDIVINITGGKVMNVYGGSGGASSTAVNNNTYIYMTGGLAEALFGGCEKTAMTGNTLIYVGGTADVSRRIYGGCYNDWSFFFGWDSSNCVTGSTTVIIDSGCQLASKTELSSENQDNMGVFAGSRARANASNEVSTLIFLNDCYSTYSSKIGDVSGWGSTFKSHHDYVVKVSSGGSVTNSTTAGVITLKPNMGNKAVIGSNSYLDGETYTLSSSETVVTFTENIVDYTVEHRIKTNNGSELYKAETLQGRVSSATAAVPLNALGYTADYTDTTIKQSGTVVVITYTPLPASELSRGDINCDETVDLLDVALLQRYIAEWDGYNVTTIYVPNGDMNDDGIVDAADNLLLIIQLANQHKPEAPDKPNEPIIPDDDFDNDYSGDQTIDNGWGPWV